MSANGLINIHKPLARTPLALHFFLLCLPTLRFYFPPPASSCNWNLMTEWPIHWSTDWPSSPGFNSYQDETISPTHGPGVDSGSRSGIQGCDGQVGSVHCPGWRAVLFQTSRLFVRLWKLYTNFLVFLSVCEDFDPNLFVSLSVCEDFGPNLHVFLSVSIDFGCSRYYTQLIRSVGCHYCLSGLTPSILL